MVTCLPSLYQLYFGGEEVYLILFFLNNRGTTVRWSNNNAEYLALHSCGAFTAAQVNTPYEYLPLGLKIVLVRSGDNAIYGETRFMSRSTA